VLEAKVYNRLQCGGKRRKKVKIGFPCPHHEGVDRWRLEVTIHSFLNLEINGGGWSTLSPDSFTLFKLLLLLSSSSSSSFYSPLSSRGKY
jgi:hypothetical protein